MLEVKDLKCGYRNHIVLENVSFTAETGDIICMLGPNGSGKSTLIKTMIGLLDPYEGEVLLNGEDIKDWSWKDRAKIISYIPQTFSSMFQYRGIVFLPEKFIQKLPGLRVHEQTSIMAIKEKGKAPSQ